MDSTLKWRDGFAEPKGITALQVAEALDELEEPSPDNLYEASKSEQHVLHGYLWDDDDSVWAERARKEACRHVIGAIVETRTDDEGEEYTFRRYEFVDDGHESAWERKIDIIKEPVKLAAHMEDIARLQREALAKMESLKRLIQAET